MLGKQPDGAAAFDGPESTYPLGDGPSVALQTRGGEVEMRLSGNPLTLDATALERLIAALERHRPSLHAR